MYYQHNNKIPLFGNTLKVEVESLPSSIGIPGILMATTMAIAAFTYSALGGTDNVVVDGET